MAVGATNLTTSFSDTDATSYNTASVAPTSNALLLLAVENVKGSTPDTPTASGNGLTWVQIATINHDNVGTQRRLTLFRALGASPSSGAVTIDFGGNTQTACAWSLTEHTGVDTSGTNGSGAVVQYNTTIDSNNNTGVTVTLSAFGSAANATYGCFGIGVAATITAGSGFTIIGQASSTTPGSTVASEFRSDNDTSVDASWATDANTGGIAVEIKAAAGGGAAPARQKTIFINSKLLLPTVFLGALIRNPKVTRREMMGVFKDDE